MGSNTVLRGQETPGATTAPLAPKASRQIDFKFDPSPGKLEMVHQRDLVMLEKCSKGPKTFILKVPMG